MSVGSCIKEILLSQYLDGELSEDASRKVRDHIAVCPKCNAVYERMKADREMLRRHFPDSPPPDHLKSELLRRIGAGREIGRHSRIPAWAGISRLHVFASKPWISAAAAAFFLAVAISAFHLQRRFEEAKILEEIDRSGAQIASRDFSSNPFNIYIQEGALQAKPENPFKRYLNGR